MVWCINRKGEREQIDPKEGDIWFDGGKYKLRSKGVILTYNHKSKAEKAKALYEFWDSLNTQQVAHV